MAEREGFEPSIGDKSYTPLAGARLQPLGHLSKENVLYCISYLQHRGKIATSIKPSGLAESSDKYRLGR